MKTCTNGNKWKSVCNFSCDSGYKLEGNAISTCHDEDDVNNNEYGKWNSDPPTCKSEISLIPSNYVNTHFE